jgi:hypothetical protein
MFENRIAVDLDKVKAIVETQKIKDYSYTVPTLRNEF